MKTIFNTLSIIILTLLFVQLAEAQKKSTKVKVEPEFEKFWKEFQNSFLSRDFNNLNRMVEFPLNIFQNTSGSSKRISESQFKTKFNSISEDWKTVVKKAKIKNFHALNYKETDMKDIIQLSGNPKIIELISNAHLGQIYMWFQKIDDRYKLVAMTFGYDVFDD